jgi:hypothetical protein
MFCPVGDGVHGVQCISAVGVAKGTDKVKTFGAAYTGCSLKRGDKVGGRHLLGVK